MVLRLSVSYAVVTIALLSLSGGLLYWFLKGSLEVDAMDLHGGSVTIESELQRGTSVRLMFPVPVNVDRPQILRDL
jgi:hypothetical protein